MDAHQGYKTKGNDAQCTVCGGWMAPADSCVILQPGLIQEGGHAQPTGEAIHGVVHKSCFEDL